MEKENGFVIDYKLLINDKPKIASTVRALSDD